jgi:hypothetical protein
MTTGSEAGSIAVGSQKAPVRFTDQKGGGLVRTVFECLASILRTAPARCHARTRSDLHCAILSHHRFWKVDTMAVSSSAKATLENIAKACIGGADFSEYVHGELVYGDSAALDDMRELAAAGLVTSGSFSNGAPCYTGFTDAAIQLLGLKDF